MLRRTAGSGLAAACIEALLMGCPPSGAAPATRLAASSSALPAAHAPDGNLANAAAAGPATNAAASQHRLLIGGTHRSMTRGLPAGVSPAAAAQSAALRQRQSCAWPVTVMPPACMRYCSSTAAASAALETPAPSGSTSGSSQVGALQRHLCYLRARNTFWLLPRHVTLNSLLLPLLLVCLLSRSCLTETRSPIPTPPCCAAVSCRHGRGRHCGRQAAGPGQSSCGHPTRRAS